MGERVFASGGPAEWWRLVTGAFLHGSLLHLGINMAMLMMLGRIFENVFGSPRFLVLLVASILCASALSAWVHPDAISMGASGAVMGLVGAGISFGRRHRRRIPEALHPFFGTNLVVYAALVFGLGLLPGLPIDHWGHFGGFVGGALCGALLRPVVLEPEGAPARWGTLAVPFGLSVLALLAAAANVAPRIAGASEHVVAPHIAAAMEAVGSGDLDRARKEVDLALAKAPEDPLVLMQAAELYSAAGDAPGAVELYTRLSRVVPLERWRPPMRNNFGWSLFVDRPEDRAAVAQGLALVAQDLAEDPKQPIYLNSLAYGQWLAGQYLDAFQTIERTMEIGGVSQRSSDIYIYVMARAGIGDLAGAREVFGQARAVWPEGTLAEEARRVVEERWFPAGPPLEREALGVTPLIRDPVPATMLAKAAREGREPARPAAAATEPPGADPAPPPPPPGGPAADAVRGEPAESAWTPPRAEWAGGDAGGSREVEGR
ncbi:rhomboid family intramembrane serine protease [Myxococcota bacterium]|nr:rhomboid family intramembrane serine protease [Myxococcota bacterium]